MSERRLGDDDYARLLAFRVELRRFLRRSETIAAEAGLTPALHQLLLAIRGNAAVAGPTIGAVAETLDVRHHTTVELAQRAEQAGLIDRVRGETDHRQVHLRLTPLGSERLEELSRQHLPAIGQLADRLSDVLAAAPRDGTVRAPRS
jgi:DNA-binding MarR family transcriptional regulator